MESGLTIDQLHCIYITWMRERYLNERVVSHRFYRTLFTRYYNLVFCALKTDLFNTCEVLKTKNEDKKENNKDFSSLTTQQADHQGTAAVPLKILLEVEVASRAAPQDSDLQTIAIDHQQVLPCPRLRASCICYKRKLWLYNFCVHDLNKNKAITFIWDESTAKRGSDENGSCITRWLGNKFCED